MQTAADTAIETINETADNAVKNINQTASDAVESIGKAEESISKSVVDARGSADAAANSAQQAAASASAAQTSERNAADSATQASQSATAAKQSEDNAAESERNAASSERNAASSATQASQSATAAAQSASEAQNAVGGFGLEVGTTTTGEPGSNASVEITKQENRYTANFKIPRGDKGEPGDLTTVARDDTLTGDGTSGNPLGVFQGGLFFNPLPATQLDYDSIEESTIGRIYHASGESKGTKPPANVEGICFKFRVSVFAVLEIVFSNDIDSNIYMRRNYNKNWTAWRTFAKDSTLSGYVTLATYEALETRVQALEAKLANQ